MYDVNRIYKLSEAGVRMAFRQQSWNISWDTVYSGIYGKKHEDLGYDFRAHTLFKFNIAIENGHL